ncbi:hypothetical protein [Methylobacterium sp. WL19]|uniref:hypothetical protein n=1 Tax=Methylobacterium sp. WL19 TaxID=2603896 RepID=UPI0011CBF13B|nr:hypothetical protein [Methylobacterium sp. WL19]TXN33933.1 hypothetical protein FV220_00350 [Methylobacterium sp. WL19]
MAATPFPKTERTHVVRFRMPMKASEPYSVLSETRVGETATDAAEYLAGAHLDDRPLESVIVIEQIPGQKRGLWHDVTAEVLKLVSARLDAERVELPRGLTDAYAAYGVQAPMSWAQEDFRDEWADEQQSYEIHGTNRWSA